MFVGTVLLILNPKNKVIHAQFFWLVACSPVRSLGYNRYPIKVYDVLLKGACSKVAVNAMPDIARVLDSLRTAYNLRSPG